jgi:hypothetical protein
VDDATPTTAGPRRGLTRRRALAVGAAGTAVVGFGVWGRYALGDAFEEHVAERLGLDLDLTKEILAGLRESLDDYELRATAFLAATLSPSSLALPASLRRDAVESFVNPIFGLSHEMVPLTYAGLRDTIEFTPCAVLKPGK